MENLKLSLHGTSIHIEGFPDAVAVLAVQGSKARRLADWAAAGFSDTDLSE